MLCRAATLAILTLLSSAASAHTLMTSPTPRSDSDGIKSGPCGGVAPVDPHLYQAGQTITVEWLETIDHPGYYRIAFSPGGDQGYDDNVLLDDIDDIVCSDTPCPYSAEVTLPAEPCEGCSLQLIQYMGTAAPYSPYFSCTDIQLMELADLPDAGASAEGDAGPSQTDRPGRDSGPAGSSTGNVVGGCDAGGTSGGIAALLVLAVFGWARRRRI